MSYFVRQEDLAMSWIRAQPTFIHATEAVAMAKSTLDRAKEVRQGDRPLDTASRYSKAARILDEAIKKANNVLEDLWKEWNTELKGEALSFPDVEVQVKPSNLIKTPIYKG